MSIRSRGVVEICNGLLSRFRLHVCDCEVAISCRNSSLIRPALDWERVSQMSPRLCLRRQRVERAGSGLVLVLHTVASTVLVLVLHTVTDTVEAACAIVMPRGPAAAIAAAERRSRLGYREEVGSPAAVVVVAARFYQSLSLSRITDKGGYSSGMGVI